VGASRNQLPRRHDAGPSVVLHGAVMLPPLHILERDHDSGQGRCAVEGDRTNRRGNGCAGRGDLEFPVEMAMRVASQTAPPHCQSQSL